MNSNKRLYSFLKESEREYHKYKRTKNITIFAQAGEKLWCAFNILLEEISHKKIQNFKTVKNVVKEIAINNDDSIVLQLFNDLYALHVFFYRGWTEDITIEEDKYISSLALIRATMKRYDVK